MPILGAYWETSQLGHGSHYSLAAGKNLRLSQLQENAGRVAPIAGTDLSARGSLVDLLRHLWTESVAMFYTLN